MPTSLVLYTDRDIYSLFEETLADTFRDCSLPPYTLSYPQKTKGDTVRARITEVTGREVEAIVAELTETKRTVLASDSDPDVIALTYQDMRDNADRFNREVRLQFASPTLLGMGSYQVQFPVVPLLFRHYLSIWNAFAPDKITLEPTLLESIRFNDFRISSDKTSYGVAFQGWVDLEIGKGRTEDDIALVNLLCDFSFFCGTGLYTQKGLGQTRRARREH
jgi:CRISPR/Cas system endoribonuclease Cas6 (RAMP superfamily)